MAELEDEGFHTVVLHYRPHFDEILALWLMVKAFPKKAEALFPKISTAGITFANAGTVYSSPSADMLERQGYLCIGVGGGRFDEHPTLRNGRKNNECATTLISETLGIAAAHPELRQLIDYARRIDLEGGAHPFELPSLIKLLQLQAKNEAEMREVIAWASTALDAWWWARQSHHTARAERILEVVDEAFTSWLLNSRESKYSLENIKEEQRGTTALASTAATMLNISEASEFKQLLEYLDISIRGGFHAFGLGKLLYLLSEESAGNPNKVRDWVKRILYGKLQEQRDFLDALEELDDVAVEKIQGSTSELLLVVAHSNNYQISRAVRYRYKNHLGIFIQVRTSGHVQIFVNYIASRQLSSNPIAYHVRLAEQRYRGRIITADRRELVNEGKVLGAEVWHHFSPAHMMLNQTPTSPETPPTIIPIKVIIEIVRNVLAKILNRQNPF